MTTYITGVGKTRFGPTTKTLPQLMQEASLAALKDAELEPKDLDAVIIANFLGGPNEKQLHLNSVFAGVFPGLNIPAWRTETACASGGAAIHQATLALSRYPRILVLGIEKLTAISGMELTRNIGMAGDALLDQIYGVTFPANYALLAQNYFRRWGGNHHDLELISYKNHQNALLNPCAHFHHKTVTMEDIDTSPMVASPLNLFDCCPISDGAAAAILEGEPRTNRSLPILASVLATDVISLSQRPILTSLPAAKLAAQQAYQEAGLTADDIDFAEVHDCFTIGELVSYEDLGFAQEGQGVQLLRDGGTQRNGRIPVNASGGLKAGGHPIGATGVGQIYELTSQLRGEAHERQLPNVSTGLAHNVGGIGGTCTVTIVGGRS